MWGFNKSLMTGVIKPSSRFPGEFEPRSCQVGRVLRVAAGLAGTGGHLLVSPVLANVIWIGGGSVGVLLAIVVVVLLLPR